MSRPVVIYDTEYTSWEGAHESGWAEPWQHRELVQIGALRFDLENLTPLDSFEILVRPKINPVLSDYFTNLTGISNTDIADKGHDFPDAYHLFLAFLQDDPAVSFGADDAVVRENLNLHGMPAAFSGHNIRPWFLTHGAAFGIDAASNSGSLAAKLGIILDGAAHNALFDTRSIAAAYGFLRQKGAPDFTIPAP